MTRIHVTEPDYETYDSGDMPWQPRRDVGYFTLEKATYWNGNKEAFDGANLADVNTRDQHRGEGLYLTAQGRWVLSTWSNWAGETPTYVYVTAETARDWLIFNEYDSVAEEHFGDIEEERGPGRPEVGNIVNVRLGELKDPVDAYAEQRGWKRAETVRHLVKVGLLMVKEESAIQAS
jgi:hypothetical protein